MLEKVSPAVITVSVPERAAPPTEAVAGSLEAGTKSRGSFSQSCQQQRLECVKSFRINYEYSNQFRTNVFSPKSEVLTRVATMSMFTIKDSMPSFTYVSTKLFK